MNSFFCLFNGLTSDSLDLEQRVVCLRGSCGRLGVDFVPLDESRADFAKLPVPDAGDALYNCARGSRLLEQALINPQVRTFYRRYPGPALHANTNQLTLELEKHGVPVPVTIHRGTSDRLLLEAYVHKLGGFPVVLKLHGGTGGIGVMLAKDFETLFSLCDYLASTRTDYCMKQFIPSESCERLTVLGDEVIGCFRRPTKKQDFRSDVYDARTTSVQAPPHLERLAVQATHAANLNYAGVDILVDSRDGRPYVLEVNCPQNFVIHQKVAGVSYSDRMIAWLFGREARQTGE